ncbi:putative ABC transporter ATP-binding protein [Gordonia effusa NBRC 100432]|uniref:Putative ABC transporter ATP-binding protein n=1 Tax=Gordonia effusa NBRC 100432 TaxID=1077974 RepID=H0R471_9ACTN|nr:ATP-binding cassette domain-containing protein [Gordonia effusa]GAB19872.1 putative ABC transporter ATP-binding protein [Gordonia effusa NBRC 100432]
MGRHRMAESSREPALTLRGVSKTYRSGLFGRGTQHHAVRDLDLEVPAGSVHALLGPNGAGKTTSVAMVATLLEPDAGQIQVGGIDARKEPARVRDIIGVSGQYAAVDGNLTGFENLRMVAQLYGHSRREASSRARQMIDELDLTTAADRPMRTYSGGMRRRLDLAGAVINRPTLVILDEPTTGLDPRGRRQIWEVIDQLVQAGTTVLLTTQYLEEADELADEITLIDGGVVQARGTPQSLKSRFGQSGLRIEVAPTSPDAEISAALMQVGAGEPRQLDDRNWEVPIDAGTRSAVAAVQVLQDRGVECIDAVVTAPTLDAVFLALTGSDTQREVVDVL